MDHLDITLQYFWGDDSLHSEVLVVQTPSIVALVNENKPEHASVAYCSVYINDVYHSHVEII